MRPADKHLTPQELDLLLLNPADSRDSNATGALPPEARQHLNGCVYCQSVAEKCRNAEEALRNLRSWGKTSGGGKALAPGAECPPEDTWSVLAVGLMKNEESATLVTHAATCGWCGPRLKEAMRDLAQDITAEEQEALDKLASASPSWQRAMAQKLAAACGSADVPLMEVETPARNKKSRNKEKAGFGWWPKLVWAGSGLAVVVVAVLVGVKLTREPDVNQLLAQAYTEQRTIELRMPGARYGPMRVQRAGADRDLPAEFYRAKDIIKTNSGKYPDDPGWLQAQARAHLLEWDYEDAIKELDDALRIKEDPSLLMDRATALFQRAEKEGGNASIDYGEAAENLSQAIRKDPYNQVALFNRAIIYEKLNLPNEAVADLAHYLALGSRDGWADEAKARLEQLKARLRDHGHALLEQLASPEEFVRLSNSPETTEQLNARIEDYQDVALKEWLPAAFPVSGGSGSQGALSALRVLADLLITRHNDHWLSDVLDFSNETPALREGLFSLQEAVLQTGRGDPSGAYAEARKAAASFNRAGNPAARLRAEVEEVHALQRGQHGDRCLERAGTLLLEMQNYRYSWLRTQLKIEQIGCSAQVGKFEAALTHADSAEQSAALSSFPILQLRSIGLKASVQIDQGDLHSGWATNQKGLSRFWTQKNTRPIRAQQFYDSSVYAAEDLNYLALAEAFAAEDARAAAAAGYKSTEALVRSHLGKIRMQLGKLEQAQSDLDQADGLLSALPQTETTLTYRIDAEFDLAELDILKGDLDQARKHVDRVQPLLEGRSNFNLPLRRDRIEARLLVLEKREDDAETALQRAASIAEANLRQIRDEPTRYYWREEVSQIFRDFSQLEIQRKRPEQAFLIWEWYKSALQEGLPAFPASELLQQRVRGMQDRTVVSYALLPEGVAIWVIDDRGINSHFVKIAPDKMLNEGLYFARLCASPEADITRVNNRARDLYDLLFKPVVQELTPDRRLIFEIDEPLAAIPFQAFQSPSGMYLQELYPIVFIRNIDHQEEKPPPITAAARALIVASNASLNSFGTKGDLVDVNTEAEMVAANFDHPWVINTTEATATKMETLLPAAEMLHFAGHAIAGRNSEGLLIVHSYSGDRKVEVWGTRQIISRLFRRCKLVILAACSTGTNLRGKKETHGRIVQAMLSAGVTRVVAAQWDIDSAATVQYMRAFYSALIQSGDAAVAAQAAARSSRSQQGTRLPYYWAAFVVFGQS